MWRPGTEKPLSRPTERSDAVQSTISTSSNDNETKKMLSKKNLSQKTLAMKVQTCLLFFPDFFLLFPSLCNARARNRGRRKVKEIFWILGT